MDLEKFFDRVNHDVLMARVARRVKDKRVLLSDPPLLAGGNDGGRAGVAAHGGHAARRAALAAAVQHPARRVGPGTGATRASLRPLRRRLQRVCAVEGGGRASAGIAGALSREATPAAGESREERRGTAVEAEVSGLQCHAGPRSTPAGVARSRATAEDETAKRAAREGEAGASPTSWRSSTSPREAGSPTFG